MEIDYHDGGDDMRETVAIGLIDREGCAGCVNEHKFLTVCCEPYVDLSSECLSCDAYSKREGGEDGA